MKVGYFLYLGNNKRGVDRKFVNYDAYSEDSWIHSCEAC